MEPKMVMWWMLVIAAVFVIGQRETLTTTLRSVFESLKDSIILGTIFFGVYLFRQNGEEGAKSSTRKWDATYLKELQLQTRGWRPPKGLRHANIVLVGLVQSGKSSFINTVRRALTGAMSEDEIAQPWDESLTQNFKKCDMPGCNFSLCDIAGIQSDTCPDSVVKNFDDVINGRISYGQQIDLNQRGFFDGLRMFKPDRVNVHGFVLVVDSIIAEVLTTSTMQWMRRVQEKARNRGMTPFVILTKVDILDSNLKEHLELVHESDGVRHQMRKLAESIQVNPCKVSPVRNYSEQRECDIKLDILALKTLQDILNETTSSILRCRYY